MSIGENIKRIRKEKGLTQKELADKCNLSRSYLADVERDRYNPSLDTLMVIAKNLDVKVSTLLGENEEFDYDSIRISRIARHAKDLTISDQEMVIDFIELLKKKSKLKDAKNDEQDQI